MDIFKFNNPTHALKMESGEILNGLDSVMWIERYRKPGEFEIKAPASTGIREKLALDTFISKPDTTRIMVVEDHEITEEKDQEPIVRVTGRTFETLFELRSVDKTSGDTGYPRSVNNDGYRVRQESQVMPVRIVKFINDHVQNPGDNDDKLSYTQGVHNLVGGPVDEKTRRIEYGNLYERLIEFATQFGYDVRNVRPGPWNPISAVTPNTAVELYEGIDRSSELFLSYELGDIDRAEYLWSNRNKRTAAHVVGKWYQTIYFDPSTVSDYDRRYIYIDASNVDSQYSTAPTVDSGAYNTLISDLEETAKTKLAALNGTALVKAEISETFERFRFRHDFEVGDLITVLGNYGAQAVMRVTEYVEILDETGFKSYPVLSLV